MKKKGKRAGYVFAARRALAVLLTASMVLGWGIDDSLIRCVNAAEESAAQEEKTQDEAETAQEADSAEESAASAAEETIAEAAEEATAEAAVESSVELTAEEDEETASTEDDDDDEDSTDDGDDNDEESDEMSGSWDNDTGSGTWSIDEDGVLTVDGTGDIMEYWSSPPWYSYRTSITSAVVNLTGATNLSYMFNDCSKMESIDLSGLDASSAKTMRSMFWGCKVLESIDLSGFDMGNVTDMYGMFYNCRKLKSIDLSGVDTSSVKSMQGMFWQCRALESIDLSGFDTSSVTDMNYVFWECCSLTSLDLSSFDTSNVTGMNRMFYDCESLESVDLSSFDTSNVTNMAYMFYECIELKSIDLSGFNTENVTDMSYMFMDCESLESIDVSGFDTGNVTGMSHMFRGCELKSIDLSGFDTSNVTSMEEMFRYCEALESLDLSGFDVSSVTSADNMLDGCTALTMIYTPKNLSLSVTLPTESDTDVWYMSDGTAVTELPQSLSYSETLWKNSIPAAESISVTKTKTLYEYGDELDADDLTVTLNYDNGTTEEISDYTTNIDELSSGTLGEKTLTVTYGEFTADVILTVKARTLDDSASVTLPNDSYEYTGTEITPEPAVSVNGAMLLNGTDYTVSYADNVNVGTAQITITGIGNYQGTLICSFTIQETSSQGDGSEDESGNEDESSGETESGSEDESSGETESGSEDESSSEAESVETDEEADGSDDDLFTNEIETVYYTGLILKPAVKVYDGDKLLKSGKNYTIKYVNNINANAAGKSGGSGTSLSDTSNGFDSTLPYVHITGFGNYAFDLYVNFTILPASIGDGQDEADGITLAYTQQSVINEKKAVSVFSSIKYKKKMTQGTDYDVTLTDDSTGETLSDLKIPAGGSGTYTLTITGKGNYTGSIEKTVYVTDKEHLLKNAKVTLGKNIKSMQYTGDYIKPAASDTAGADVFTVKLGKTTLTYGTDYTVDYLNNRSVGTATIVITGKGEYAGVKTAAFKINGTVFSAKKVSVEGLSSLTYTGTALTQEGLKLSCGGKALTEGTDYTVTYKNNINKGKASATFTGLAEAGYTGSFTKTFVIAAMDIGGVTKDMAGAAVQYSRSGAEPDITLTYNGIALVNGTDYTISYSGNKELTDKAAVTFKGKGNYTGTLTETFAITEKALSSEDITLSAVQTAYRAKKDADYAYTPKLTVEDGTAKLKENADYIVEYYNNTQADYEAYLAAYKAGTADASKRPYAEITAVAGSGYTGTAQLSILPVYEKKLSSSNMYVEVGEAIYTGSLATPEVTVYYGTNRTAVRNGDTSKLTKLAQDADYTVTYQNNGSAGTNKGTVTITGQGPLYGGSMSVKFTISSKALSW